MEEERFSEESGIAAVGPLVSMNSKKNHNIYIEYVLTTRSGSMQDITLH